MISKMEESEEYIWVVDNGSSSGNFLQQTLPGLMPQCSSIQLAILTTIMACFFLIFGIPILVTSVGVREVVIPYKGGSLSNIINISFPLENQLKSPIYVFYRLNNFYQNHRRFVTSRNYEQLFGNEITSSDKEVCDYRLKENQEVFEQPFCGIAYSILFNDSISLYENIDDHYTPVNIIRNDLVFSSDKTLYKAVGSENAISWMKPAALPTFRKPIGKIEESLNPGKYMIQISNNYNITLEGKDIILSNNTWLGKKNTALGVVYLVLAFVLAILS
eukprot:MONOS_3134.1-p1 / transcript=MONOS_3134.1 / gene=MONOS_3134 / organism=Monocercomonoides_exilis_PA203 / gene_product=LEM3 / transcript_product=LEM3 / location=Mono_scaffold00071:47145-48778(+) / protein_length=274 / sequence_SO=supercontig / SO=protein_coding / is_pseudo=false